jgi:hypothetical protein
MNMMLIYLVDWHTWNLAVHRRKLADSERWKNKLVEMTFDIQAKSHVDMKMYLPCGVGWTQRSLPDCMVDVGRWYLSDVRLLGTCQPVRWRVSADWHNLVDYTRVANMTEM